MDSMKLKLMTKNKKLQPLRNYIEYIILYNLGHWGIPSSKISINLFFHETNDEIPHFADPTQDDSHGTAYLEPVSSTKYNLHIFLLNIDGTDSLIKTISHEITHLKQIFYKNLSYSKDASFPFIWIDHEGNGFSYSINTPYDQMPWEHEAIQESNRIFPMIMKEIINYFPIFIPDVEIDCSKV